MAEQEDCKFCPPNEKVKQYLSDGTAEKVKQSLSDGTDCNTCIYDDKHCYAILSDKPYTDGHTLVVLKKRKTDIEHKTDITDKDIALETDLSPFIQIIYKVAKHLKESAKNNRGEPPDKIYVCMLGDGIKHLHAHLIPRYPFTEDDKTTYRDIFTLRDGALKVNDAIKSCEIGGFWYVAEREKNCEFTKKSKEERASILKKQADDLRLT